MKQIKKSIRGQLKIQQTAFMLLALVFLFSIVFIFYINFSRQSIYDKRNELQMQEAYTLLQKFSGSSEFSCISSDLTYCLDEDKLTSLANMSQKYKSYFSSVKSIVVREVYPGNKIINIFETSIAEDEEILYYSAFIPLCKTKALEGYNWQQCKLAKFIIGMKQFKIT